eukprot:1158835-Pelagomonas_calceolata.AAC.8
MPRFQSCIGIIALPLFQLVVLLKLPLILLPVLLQEHHRSAETRCAELAGELAQARAAVAEGRAADVVAAEAEQLRQQLEEVERQLEELQAQVGLLASAAHMDSWWQSRLSKGLFAIQSVCECDQRSPTPACRRGIRFLRGNL